MKKHMIVFEPSGLRLSVRKQTSFLEAIRETGLHVSSQCGGNGSCGKCHIRIHPAPKPKTSDSKFLSLNEIENGYRLACQHYIDHDSRVILTVHPSDAKILRKGESIRHQWKPDAVKKDQLGIAIDLGTTTIVVYLLDLSTGVQLGQVAGLNPQVVYGEDVMSRITYAVTEPEGNEKLAGIVREEIDSLICQVAESTGLDKNRIARLSIVGNTAMHHLLLKTGVKSLGVAPYEPTIRDAVSRTGESIGLRKVTSAKTYLPPNIAGFVGGDTVGFILSQRLDMKDEIVLGIDIGTNGEIVLSNRGELFCCSVAAGSAFEGANIHNGMRGKTGAIEQISIKNPDEPPEITVIGDETPQGLCGSGIVDVTAELIIVGLLDSGGRLQTISRRVSEDAEHGLQYLITNNEESGAEREIVFTQKDVRQVQLAKGAIHTGGTILLKEAGLKTKDIDTVMLAGAFGSYIQPKSALTIGLFPGVKVERVSQVGNAAGEGAKILLLSHQSREFVERLVTKINYLELANHEDFQSIFLESLKFPE